MATPSQSPPDPGTAMSEAQRWLRRSEITRKINYHVAATTFIMMQTLICYRSTCTEILNVYATNTIWIFSSFALLVGWIYVNLTETHIILGKGTSASAKCALVINCAISILIAGTAGTLYHFHLLSLFELIWLATVFSINALALILNRIFHSAYHNIRSKESTEPKQKENVSTATKKKTDKEITAPNLNMETAPNSENATKKLPGMDSFECGMMAHAFLWALVWYCLSGGYQDEKGECLEYPYAFYLYRSFGSYFFAILFCANSYGCDTMYERVLKYRYQVFLPSDEPAKRSSFSYVVFIVAVHFVAACVLHDLKLLPKNDSFPGVCFGFLFFYFIRALCFSKFYSSVKEAETKEQVTTTQSSQLAAGDVNSRPANQDPASNQPRNTVDVINTISHNVV